MLKGQAENSGNAKFSNKKYYQIRALIFSKFGSFKSLGEKMRADMRIQYVAEVLKNGDTQPAIVASSDPFLVSAYSDEMDAVVMLEFPKELMEKYRLSVGSRLVASCVYGEGGPSDTVDDIFPGEGCTGSFRAFLPVVQLFLASDEEAVISRTSLFDEEKWKRVEALTKEYLEKHPGLKRDGFRCFK